MYGAYFSIRKFIGIGQSSDQGENIIAGTLQHFWLKVVDVIVLGVITVSIEGVSKIHS